MPSLLAAISGLVSLLALLAVLSLLLALFAAPDTWLPVSTGALTGLVLALGVGALLATWKQDADTALYVTTFCTVAFLVKVGAAGVKAGLDSIAASAAASPEPAEEL